MRTRELKPAIRESAALPDVLIAWLRSPAGRWTMPAVGALAAGCIALCVQTLWPTGRIATARVVLDAAAAGQVQDAPQWIGTQVALLRSERVARQVLNDLGPGAASMFDADSDAAVAHLMSHLRVQEQGNGGLIAIAYRGASAGLSAQVANAFIAAYDRVSRDMRTSAVASELESARQKMLELHEQVRRAQARMSAADGADLQVSSEALTQAARVARLTSQGTWSAPDPSAADDSIAEAPAGAFAADAGVEASARDELALAQQAFAAARSRFGELNAEQVRLPFMTILDAAHVAPEAAWGARVAWLAVLAGLCAGMLSRRIAQWIDPRIAGTHDLRAVLGIPVLGSLVNTQRSVRPSAALPRRSAAAAPMANPPAGTLPALP